MKRLAKNRYVVIFSVLTLATVIQLFRVFSPRQIMGFTMTGLLGLVVLGAIGIFAVGLYNAFERPLPPLPRGRTNPNKWPAGFEDQLERPPEK